MKTEHHSNGAANMNEIRRLDPIEVAIRFIRADGPVTKAQIERELLAQCSYTKTGADAKRQADKAIKHGFDGGYLEMYDETSYIIAG